MAALYIPLILTLCAANGVIWFVAWLIINELRAEVSEARSAAHDFERLYLDTKAELDNLWHHGLHGHKVAHEPSERKAAHEFDNSPHPSC